MNDKHRATPTRDYRDLNHLSDTLFPAVAIIGPAKSNDTGKYCNYLKTDLLD